MSLTHHSPISFIPTRDAQAARAFYAETLGLTFVSDDGYALVFAIGPTKTMLRIIRVEAFTPQPFAIFGWESPQLEVDIESLAAKGVEFLRFGYFEQDELGIWTAPNGNTVAWFKDPDGNTISISSH